MMKNQISYTRLSGEHGVTLVGGSISSTLQAKRELANKLDLPHVNTPAGQDEDVDARLHAAGIDPSSVQHLHISE
jgi:hypothetical protein